METRQHFRHYIAEISLVVTVNHNQQTNRHKRFSRALVLTLTDTNASLIHWFVQVPTQTFLT